MNKSVYLLALICLFSSALKANTTKESIAKQAGIEQSIIDSVELGFEVNVEQICNAHTEACNILKNHCNQNPYPNICMMKAVYHNAIREEFCVSDQSCVLRQSRSENKYVNFVEKHAQQPGYGRLAINVCAPLHEFASTNSNLREIGNALNTVGGIGIYYDYESLFECVGETYKKAAMSGLQ
ncbi:MULTISPECIES: hypothetical protein [Vibrio]|uniref:hypothetical protein n=1 Tax=Vibrio TaxID=662 RepID=UPI000DE2C1C5|nr:hypothetical protein [Vibrio tarriae]RBM35757.1 hypothetical protein DLR62_17225 [Vibrio tarriae]